MIQRVKNKIAVLRADPHMQEVVRGTLLAFVLKVIGAGLAFAFNVAVARLLGAEGAGLYFLALSVTTIGSVIGRVGLDNALLRFVATRATHEDWAGVKGVYALGMRMAVVASGAITLIVFFAAPWMATVLFKKPELAEPLRWMSFSILPFAILNLQAESLKGLKRIRDAMLVQGVGVSLVSLLLIYPLSQIAGLSGVVWAYTAATILVVLLGAWVWHSSLVVHGSQHASFPFKMLWESCKPLLMMSVMNRAILAWAPLFLLGVWASSAEVGIFGAALRVAMLVSFMLLTINNVLAQKIAELFTKGDMKSLEATARHSALLVTLMASPLFLVLFLGGDWVLGMFGHEFEQGARALQILAMAQLINAVTGSVGFVLTMSGKESEAWKSVHYSAWLLVVASLWLIPIYGMVGAALAILLGELCKNSMLVYYCRRKLGINPIPFANFGMKK